MENCRAFAWNHDPNNRLSPLAKDATLAAGYDEKACAGGVPLACFSLAILDINPNGLGLPQSVPRAVRALDRACKLQPELGCGLFRSLATSEAAAELAGADRTVVVSYANGKVAWQRRYSKGALVAESEFDAEGRPAKGLPQELVDAVVRYHAGEGAVCGIHDPAKPAHRDVGPISVTFEVAGDGSVARSQIAVDPAPGSAEARCLEGLVQSWRFPRHDAGRRVRGSSTWSG